MASSYETTKNCPALAIEGHSYRFDKLITKDTKKRWRCRTRDCNGSLYTNNNEEKLILTCELLIGNIVSLIQK